MTTPVGTGVAPNTRETAYRVVSGAVTLLLGIGVFDANQSVLWGALGLSTVTLIFALLNSTSNYRTALYAVVGPLGAVLGAYGLLQNVDWALIAVAVAQAFGITTAAAKTIQ